MKRHWYVSDGNHRHYLILAENAEEAVSRLVEWIVGTEDDYDPEVEFFTANPVPEIAAIDNDSGIDFYKYPLSSER